MIKKLGANAVLGSLEQAASADIIILFLPKDNLEKVLHKLPDMSGKIIVHTGNLIFEPGTHLSGITHAITCKITVFLIPEAYIAKLFTPLHLQGAGKGKGHMKSRELFFTADQKASRNRIRGMLKTLNFIPIDLSVSMQR